jgi:hypothetical protein
VDHPQDPLDPERPPSAVPGDPHLQPLASILFGTAGDSLLKAYPPLPMEDAADLMHRIAHDQQLTPVERADSMLGLVSMPGTVLFNADDTKAWQVLLGGVARPILPPVGFRNAAGCGKHQGPGQARTCRWPCRSSTS